MPHPVDANDLMNSRLLDKRDCCRAINKEPGSKYVANFHDVLRIGHQLKTATSKSPPMLMTHVPGMHLARDQLYELEAGYHMTNHLTGGNNTD